MEVEYESTDESIATTNITYPMNLYPISYDDVKIGMWVINIYENEKWLVDAVNKKANQICVRCLEKPYGVNEPQNLEREEKWSIQRLIWAHREREARAWENQLGVCKPPTGYRAEPCWWKRLTIYWLKSRF